MERLLQDIKYSLRMFAQQRAFTFAAVTALALGIGATTAVFTVFDAVLLRPFPFPDPDRIVLFMNANPRGSNPASSPAKLAHWEQQTDVVQDATGFRTVVMNYTGGDVPEQLRSLQVRAPFFKLFGATPLLGRTFTPEEDRPGGGRVVVLSHGLWTRRFAGDPAIVGKTISLSGEPYTVLGVIKREFDPSDLGDQPDLFTPFQLDPNTVDQAHFFRSAARIKPGVTLAQAQAKLKQSATVFREKFPNALGKDGSFSVEPLQQVYTRGSKTLLLIFLTAVSGVLLIACANVANLMLVRSTVRKREMAIRSAMGADRRRIVRQLLTESALLSTIGGALGLALGVVGIRWLLTVNTAGLPRLGDNGSLVQLDWRVLVFTAVVSLGTGLLFGLVPAFHAARSDLNTTLREGGGAASGGRSNRVRSSLVVLEIALALTLVIGSGLLIRTSLALRAVTPGFDANNVLTMRMAFTGDRYAPSAAVDRAIRDGMERVRRVPGVVNVTAACCLPLEGGFGLPFKIVGRALQEGPWHGGGSWMTTAPGYFEVFKIPVLRGRTFNDNDTQASTPVVIINEAMAKEFWKTGDPLTDRLTIARGGMREFAGEPDRQIIGIVADSRDNGLNQDPQPKMFIPQSQVPDVVNKLNTAISPTAWAIKTSVPPMSINAAVQEQLHQATGLPVADVRTMSQIVSRSTSREAFNMLLMTVFATSALALAAIGIYGVMAYAVQQRTREIGVRMALGAAPGAVRSMVVLQGLRLALIGVVIGVTAAYGLSKYMSTLLFGVNARDPLVFVGVPVLLAAVALLATWIPAARASKIDPLGALRSS